LTENDSLASYSNKKISTSAFCIKKKKEKKRKNKNFKEGEPSHSCVFNIVHSALTLLFSLSIFSDKFPRIHSKSNPVWGEKKQSLKLDLSWFFSSRFV
jgi:hypothetical protein